MFQTLSLFSHSPYHEQPEENMLSLIRSPVSPRASIGSVQFVKFWTLRWYPLCPAR